MDINGMYAWWYLQFTWLSPWFLAQKDDYCEAPSASPIGSQPQDKQQLLPEDLPERFYVTWLGEEKQFSAILQEKWAIRIYTQCIYNITNQYI